MRINVRLAALFRPLGGHGKDRRDLVTAAPVAHDKYFSSPWASKNISIKTNG
jgi:hypothetical protein